MLLEGHGIDGLGDVPDVYPAVKDVTVAPSKGTFSLDRIEDGSNFHSESILPHAL